MAQAEIDGFIDRQRAIPRVIHRTEEHEQYRAVDIWNTLLADYPDHAEIIFAVGRVGRRLPELLSGNTALTQPESPRSVLASIFGKQSKSRLLTAVLNSIGDARGRMPPGDRLGILEVSSHGQTIAAELAPFLDPNHEDLVVVANSVQELRFTEDLVRDHPWVALDTVVKSGMQSAESQEDGSESPITTHRVNKAFRSDIAIVYLDFRTDTENYRAVDYALTCLKPGGALIVIGHHPTRWVDFVLGMNASWWGDQPLNIEKSPQITRATWETRLAGLGLERVSHMEASREAEAGAYLLIGKKPSAGSKESWISANETPRSWLLISDSGEHSVRFASQLARTLQQFGGIATVSSAQDQPSIANQISEMEAQFGELDGIIHLHGLGNTAVSSAVDRCMLTAQIVSACESTGSMAPVLILTSEVFAQVNSTLDHPSYDHILAGFTRSLLNEHTANRIRLIDIEPLCSDQSAFINLVEEILLNSRETEVCLSEGRGRFVPRVQALHEHQPIERRLSMLPANQEATSDENCHRDNLRLCFTQPGQLRNLIWEPIPRVNLSPDEVEVAVRSTGLNFRDIMYTLGLLSDEGIEGGFAGPTLGLEFAGKVTRVGSAVTHVSVGDRVVGFGPGCFAKWVVTSGAAVSYIPRKLSYEAAATIPSAFLTSYYALCHLAQLSEGERVLIHGAAGGVGLAAIQFAKWRRAEIFATAGSDEKRELLKMIGVDHVLDSRSLRFADEIMALTHGQGVDVILNSLAGEAINRNFSLLRPFGRFLELGKRDFYENTRIGLKPFRNNISYFGIDADQLMHERPELTRQLFSEVIGLFEHGTLHALPYTSFEAREVESAFRYMQQSQQIGKVVITYRNGYPAPDAGALPPIKRDAFTLRPDGSYLVTGGLRGFGLRTAQWLARKGAKHLILVGRSGPSTDEAQKGIADIQSLGATVTALSCDVTDMVALRTSLAPWRENIRGIVHAAAVIEDSLIRNLSKDALTRVLEPKVSGARNLHAISLDLSLDFFALYSSATTLFGNPGQAAYVAANSWLEGLAQFRRSKGLPATCILWGAIEDAGFLARNSQIRESLQQRMGGRALSADSALDQLDAVLSNSDPGEVGVLEFDWQALARFLPTSGAPRFESLARGLANDNVVDQDIDFRQIAQHLDDDELIRRLVELIRNELGQILRIAPEKLQTEKSMYDMGLDSLMAVELVVALESRFQVRLPVMALSESPTIGRLADKLKSILRASTGEDCDPASNLDASTYSQAATLVRQHDSESTPEEILALVKKLDHPARHAEPGGVAP